jgi:transcriptional regulator with XRE-family HTH domain
MKQIYRVVGEGIRAERLQLGLTLEDLGELSSLHASYIGQIERNAKKASLETIASLADALNVPVGRFFAREGPSKKAIFAAQLEVILRANTERRQKLILEVLRQLSKSLSELR